MQDESNKNKTKNAVEQINALFSIMFGLFPSTYSVLKDEETINHAKKVWLDSFYLHGLVVDDRIDRDIFLKGLIETSKLTQQFMPSFGQFLNLCLDE